ncbi:hypothetical protein LMJ38_25770 [Streptomyces sp. R1]|uniref:hypothetical protein n=1 Tax=Streptomyces TaxID=1883 RepID=UPI00099B4FCB|nr:MULTISPECIES: hypothetical protein [unclassified Streptomyces]MCC8339328.1 hypothetical protein [Streptomyces sp. R1]MDA4892509.1 hypothetical protein [Streptomyces sp. MS2A]
MPDVRLPHPRPERGKAQQARRHGHPRAARRAWRTEQAHAHADLPEHDPDTTLVVGHWDYQGSGYSPDAALLAAHVWHRGELERRFIAEGGCG